MDKKKYLMQIAQVIKDGKFKDNWNSMSQYEVPEWYKKSKFGIFIHWGIYCIPAFGSEWYSRNMYIQGSREYEYHIKNYGKHSEFGYKDFIPMFKAEKFNPAEWADIFKRSGAKYVVPVAEHHDGFQMYKSSISKWNSYNMGPRRDVLGELSKEVEKRGIVNGASSHRIEHWFFMGHGKEFDSDVKDTMQEDDFYWPAMKEPDHQDIYSAPAPTKEYLEDWLLRCCEIVDKYHPRLIYFDWWIQHSAVKPYLKKFAAYYYNRAEQWGKGVVINYKHDAFMFGCAVPDIERGQFSQIKPYFWQMDTSISKKSWGYIQNNDYKSANSIICTLVDVVSKNGALLLNIGPKADGTIAEEEKDVLLEVGKWLEVNGEAIYNTSTWRYSSEGPTTISEGQFSDGSDIDFKSEDIRYTVNGSYLYATVLRCSENGIYNLKLLAEKDASVYDNFHGIIKSISVLGYKESPQWNRNKESLQINAPFVLSDKPLVFKIQID